MNIQLPAKVKIILDTLSAAGYEAYAVGGCIRDSLLGREPQDWDITTSATPSQVKELFGYTVDTGIQHGTVTVMLEREGFEVTTYRIDGAYEDARHPTRVMFTGNLTEDLKRRDFTMNAMAYNEAAGLVDIFDGAKDLHEKVVRCVGVAAERFAEDALRMLRAVRFCAQLGFTMAEETKDAITKLAPSLAKVSAERIQAELVKLLVSDHPQEILTVYQTGLTAVFFPELDEMMATKQNNPNHCYTVGVHTIHALMNIPPDKVLRLTMLLHDIAKPVCKRTDEQGVDHFKGHQEVGEKMARALLRRLKFDNETINRVAGLILWHDDNPPVTPVDVRCAIHRVGITRYPDLFYVKRADTMGKRTERRAEMFAYIAAYEQQFEEIIANGDCTDIKNLAVTGQDLLENGMKPGKEVGEALSWLLEQVLVQPELNTKEILLEKLPERA